jgi:predicted nucleic-acid-binding protein
VAPGRLEIFAVTRSVKELKGMFGKAARSVSIEEMNLLRTKEIVVDGADHVLKALRVFKARSADFADCLNERAAAGAGCDRTMTFDVAAATVAGMTLIS